MQLAVRHNLQVFDPADPSLCESSAIVLPIAEARAAMGETVAAYLARVAWRFDLPTVCRINGEFYARAEWETRALAVNDNVEFVSRPLGGGSSGGSTGKSILSVVALVALTAVAPYAVGAIGGALGTAALGTASALTFAGKLAAAVIVGAGALAVSHFLSPKSGGKTNSTDALYSFGLQGNAARPMQPIPVLNGRLRFAPDYAAPTYSEYAGDAMTDYALYALTCGRMRVEQVLIGDTPIWHYQTGYSPDYPGIELQVVEPGQQVTLYPVNVVTADELSGAELSQDWTPGYIINAAGTQAKELLFDLVWPGGAYVTYKDRMVAATTHVRIEARQVDDAGAPITGWTVIVDDQYQQAKDSQIRMTVRRIVAPARYEVRGRRMNPSVADSVVQKISGTDAVTWTAARAHIEGPQSFPRVMTLAVKGVASKQLSGVSGGQLRVIGTRILPVWRDGQFVEEPTRSIAWAALDWWRNGDYAAGLSISDIDFQSFVRHAALWDALGHTFDHRFTEVQNLDDVLETVLKAGRAFPAPVGDKLTITRDEPRVLPRMLFTDNDIVRDTLEIDYALSDEAWADGMVGEYVDETTWRLAEVSSAPDGVTLLKPARVQLEGVVNRKQAAGMVRMMAAESQYRRITVSWTARMEGRLLKRGDLVRITTEEPETWGQSCEVVAFQPATRRLSLDPAPEWEAGASHYVEIRRRDGSPWGPVRVTRGANDAEAIVSVSESGGVTLDDAVGRSDTQEPAWLAFSPGQPRSFPVLITDGGPDQDGEHIHLSGVMDAAEVYTTTEDGVPPLLQIPDLYSSGLPIITAIMAQITQRHASLLLTAGWPAAKNAVTYDAAISYDGRQNWIGAYSGDRTTFEAIVASSDDMWLRVRGVTPAGDPGGWSVVKVEAPDLVIPGALIDVETLPPIDYEGLTEDVRGRIDHILEVEEYAQRVAAKATADFLAADARAAAAANAAAAALDKAIEGIRNGEEIQNELIEERTARITADGAFTLTLDAAITRIGDAEAAIITERETRIADGVVFARDISGLRVQVGDVVTSVSTERQARIDGDGVLASEVSLVRATADSAAGAIVEERRVRIENDVAQVSQIQSLNIAVYDPNNPEGLPRARAAIVDERTARIAVDSALVQTIDGLTARLSTAEGTITENRRVQLETDDYQASQIQSLNLTVYDPNNPEGLPRARAAIVEERSARITDVSAQAQRIDALLLDVGGNTAAIVEERRVRIENDVYQASQITGLNTAVYDPTNPEGLPRARAAIGDERTARIQGDNALAEQVSFVRAQTDRGTATGRMTLSARSDISGVSARFEMLLAAEVNGQTRGTGMAFDLLPGGGSQVRFDADKLFITSPGASGVPAFTFDAGSGTISGPNLRLISGQASVPLRIDIGSYTLVAGPGTLNDAIDANLNFTYLVTNPDFPANIEVFGKLTISGPAGTSLLGMRLIVDGAIAGYFKFNEQSTSVSVGPNNNTFDFRASCIRYLPAGNRSVRIQYSYTSPGAGQVQINELHLAGFQPKA
ncbi:host specificity factor TipJ family phage tail protein [Methylorubrum populi]|uniref:Phage protein tail component n=1 Tax=Methylorubrum populi TaxID=223967 RepID=A0A833MVQ3_9HYPH|nr:host specificity factor TipJ family phage tail protein [Methylorubrum populi]KAB7783492.1 Phage protein tail component [Methylorubrum populi]